ncbi:hypothetical protein A1O1_08589 [Capronia coronata CBS 617.96]|uniref:Uncharacterized protein n=1 Tax=Capronia coronata CBS 617.96 TaxID=1182541 RepID=W9YDR2_9EURO|nr:uncharacterized protein A1O1_08589 [Capronia coronata CBS 617.96]EXJ80444.1 hypothetical protein A1O1_08589 [Capronia coronata CBS 617.96]
MSTTTTSIHLQPLSPTASAPASAPGQQPQPCVAPPNNIPNNNPVNANLPNAPQQAAANNLGGAAPGTTSARARVKGWLFFFVKVLAGVAALVATYIALNVALWTSVKDFRDDCRSQNTTLGVLTQTCRTALRKPLSPPPFLPKSFGSQRVKRWLESALTSSSLVLGTPTPPSINVDILSYAAAGLAGVGFFLFIASLLHQQIDVSAGMVMTLRRARNDQTMRSSQNLGAGMSMSWVANAVPRQALLSGYEHTVRKRQRRFVQFADNGDSEWLPAGQSAMRANLEAQSTFRSSDLPLLSNKYDSSSATAASSVAKQSTSDAEGPGLQMRKSTASLISEGQNSFWVSERTASESDSDYGMDADFSGELHEEPLKLCEEPMPRPVNPSVVSYIKAPPIGTEFDSVTSQNSGQFTSGTPNMARPDMAPNEGRVLQTAQSEPLSRMLAEESTTTYWTPYAVGARTWVQSRPPTNQSEDLLGLRRPDPGDVPQPDHIVDDIDA